MRVRGLYARVASDEQDELAKDGDEEAEGCNEVSTRLRVALSEVSTRTRLKAADIA